MIKAKRRGAYAGVWRLVGPDGSIVSDEIWFCYRRARRAALQYQAQTDTDKCDQHE
jgi:hypothetical protein